MQSKNVQTQSIPNPTIPARLITIPVSHYCEKARWALTRLQVPFVEERHMPPFHRFATQRIDSHSSADNVPETEGNMSPKNQPVVPKSGGRSVPVLITESTTLLSSDEILRYVDTSASDEEKLYPPNPEHRQQVEELVSLFDSVLGTAVRQWSYFYIIDQPHLLKPLWCQGVPWFESLLFPIIFPRVRPKMVQGYAINATSAIAAYESIDKIFKRVDSLLADGRDYLVDNKFSAADLTFAALAAPAVTVPSGYGVKLPDLNQLPDQMATEIQVLRETLAGKFVLRLYQERQN